MKAGIIRSLQQSLKVKRSMARRAAGDDARDRRDWAAAEREYHAHLTRMPEDQAIWVQYGHSLKEQGKRKEAEAAYREAVKLRPDDPDAHLQLGHVLKLLEQIEDARQAYGHSMELEPSHVAYEELQHLGSSQQLLSGFAMPAQNSADTVYLEIDDLLDYLRTHKTVSGIQRVQVGVITYALAEMRKGRGSYALVRVDSRGTEFLSLNPKRVAEILDCIKQPSVVQTQLVELIEAAEQNALPVTPGKGQIYFILGAFWGFNANTGRYAKLKQAGVGIGVYIYDLIPVTHPEYCDAGLVSAFAFALGDGLHVFDFVFTISEYVARSVTDFIARNGLRAVPVEAVPLAHRIHDDPAPLLPDPDSTSWKGAIAPLKNRSFVLVVCTIEPRKNHTYLHAVWKLLVEEGLDPPDLVFVGRFGWRVNDFRDMLVGTGYLGGRIHVLHDLSDVDLGLLYRSCLFTAFPSVVEGWGLPVGESLAHGRPIIASQASSIPEVGGDFVDYVDPWNVTGGIGVFKRMIFDAEYREERARNIRDNFVARTWNDVSKDLLGRLDARRRDAVVAYVPPLLKMGEFLVPSDMASGRPAPPNYAQRPLRAMLAESWYAVEAIGAWMRGKHGVLRFLTDCLPGTRVAAYMQLIGPPWSTEHTVTIRVGQETPDAAAAGSPDAVRNPETAFTLRTSGKLFCSAFGNVEADGTVVVSFEVHGPDASAHPARYPSDERIFYVGLTRFTYAAASDVELRADLFERFLHHA